MLKELQTLFLHCVFNNPEYLKGEISKHLEIPEDEIKITKEKEEVDDNNNVITKTNFVTYIGPHQYLVTKCRKPKDFKIPEKITDLTYEKFKKNVLDKIGVK